ncbi:SEL1-like repeat protein [Rhodoligotrophos defluvii]|uniref:SEL1-like repeat protein n=1 Tax=Rhodoligotrophos defluvii TaxID=2561934 RepID=UPI0010C937EB|nr:SEL1-like repeat protein [Rhodoligotrophos defluvii]
MTAGAPWSIKGIDPDARLAAKEAARKSGVTLGQWLTAVIHESSGKPASATQGAGPAAPVIQQRIEDLEQKLADLTRAQQQTAAGRLFEHRAAQEPVEALLARVDRHERRTVEAFAAINDRLSGIARQVSQNQTSSSADLSAAIETALRRILDHIASNEQRSRDALLALHERLAGLSAQAAAAQPVPGRAGGQELGALERRVDAVTARIEAAEQNIEAAAKRSAEATMGGLREEIRESERRMSRLIGEARAEGGGPGDYEDLYRQIEILSQRLYSVESERGSSAMDAQVAELANRVDELDGRVRTAIENQPSSAVLIELQSHIVALTDKLATIERRFDDIDAVERSVADLFKAMEQSKVETRALATRTAEEAVGRSLELRAGPSAELQALQSGLAAVKRSLAESDQQTQQTLLVVHETLQKIVDRLAAVEQRLQDGGSGEQPGPSAPTAHGDEGRAADIPEVLRDIRVPVSGDDVAEEKPSEGEAMPEEAPPAARLAEGEPPSEGETAGAPPDAPAPSEEQAPEREEGGEVSPPSPSDRPIETITRRDDFIAAARRAAQASAAAPEPATRRFNPLSRLRGLGRRGGEDASEGSATEEAAARRKPLILAGAVLLLLAVSAYSISGRQTEAPVATKDDIGSSRLAGTPSPAGGAQAPLLDRIEGLGQSLWSATQASDWLGKLTAPFAKPDEGRPADPPTTGSIGKSSSLLTVPTIAAVPAGLSTAASSASASPDREDGRGTVVTMTRGTAATRDGLPERIGSPALRRAALSGSPAAQFLVATELLEGEGQSEPILALRWFQKAAAQGLAPAQYRLGMMFERGTGVPRDLATARVWYKRAAEKGNIKAMHNLAVAYAGDDQGAPDYAKAAYWFGAAAEYGIRDSQYNYGVLLEQGLGVVRNLRDAYFWLTLCGRSGDAEAAQRANALKRQLTLQQIEEAEAAVARWRPRLPRQDANTVAFDEGWQPQRTPGRRADLAITN